MTDLVITIVASYLLGSIPFGYILVRTLRGQDVRQSGSGNIGATNVARAFPGLGVATLLLDASKGAAAVVLARLLFPDQKVLAAVAALCAVIGHVFPVWLKFRGGKGVATGMGAYVLLAPKAILLVAGVFAAIVLLFRHVSLGSIVAAALFPLFAWWIHGYSGGPAVLAAMTAAATLIVIKHHPNMRRLVSGSESRFEWRRR